MSLNVITYHYVRKIKKSNIQLKGLEFSLSKIKLIFLKKILKLFQWKCFK